MSSKLTPELLRSLVLSEKQKIEETLETGNTKTEKTKAKVVDADGYAKTLIKSVDWMKALSIKESKLKKELKNIEEVKKRLKAEITNITNKY